MYKYYVWITIWVVILGLGWYFWYQERQAYQAAQQWHWAADDSLLDDILQNTDESLDQEKQKLIACLQDKWVTFYGWESCGYSCEDVKKYGNDMKQFTCVDCDNNEQKCESKWITDLPVRADGNNEIAKDITSVYDLADQYWCNA